jgi:hypothetical protein
MMSCLILPWIDVSAGSVSALSGTLLTIWNL